MKDCVFCKIVAGEIPSDFIYETDELVVFPDIHPSAPIHYLIVPKKHYEDFLDAPDNLWVDVKNMAREIQIKERHNGFRLATNVGSSAMMKHMHVHYLSGIKKTRKV